MVVSVLDRAVCGGQRDDGLPAERRSSLISPGFPHTIRSHSGVRPAIRYLKGGSLIGVFIGQSGNDRPLAQGTAAQPAAPPRRVSITITQVKPDMIDAYRSLIAKEAIPVEKKSGLPWRATYVPVFGELNTFVTVRPMTNYAQFDQAAPMTRVLGEERAAALLARQRAMTVSTRRIVQTLQPEFSIESGLTSPANLVVVTDYKMMPGKGAEYNRLLTSEILPALRKSGVKEYWVHATNFGAPQQHRIVVRPIANFAELDRGVSAVAEITRLNGAEAALKVQQQFGSIVDTIEASVQRLVPEMSFGTPPQRTSK